MTHKKIRIAKLLANYNHGSRREIEKLIKEKKIHIKNELVDTPITFASIKDSIFINGKKVNFFKKNQIFKFYKPKKIICSKKKQDNRKIIYELIDKNYKNFIFAGRLDFNSEGLMILTNSSSISRNLELPINKFERKYNVRVFGEFNIKKLKEISNGIKIKNIIYKPFKFQVTSKIKKNTNLEIILKEGKKNEIREIMKFLNLQVNKLKRVSYGPFNLNKLKPGELIKADLSEIKKYENYIRIKKR